MTIVSFNGMIWTMKNYPTDTNKRAKLIVDMALGSLPKDPMGETKKNLNAVRAGRLGGLKGGKARAKALTPQKRREIARKAACKRWGKCSVKNN